MPSREGGNHPIFNRWTYAGHWDQIMEAVADAYNVDTVMVDGTSVRAHHSTTMLKERLASLPRALARRVRHKIHALVNQDGVPIRFELTPGQAHDAPPCKRLLDAL